MKIPRLLPANKHRKGTLACISELAEFAGRRHAGLDWTAKLLAMLVRSGPIRLVVLAFPTPPHPQSSLLSSPC